MSNSQSQKPSENSSTYTEGNAEEISNESTQSNAKTSATTLDIPKFGWSGYAERINGRFAMIGFIAVLLIEVLSNDSFIHWAGLIP